MALVNLQKLYMALVNLLYCKDALMDSHEISLSEEEQYHYAVKKRDKCTLQKLRYILDFFVVDGPT